MSEKPLRDRTVGTLLAIIDEYGPEWSDLEREEIEARFRAALAAPADAPQPCSECLARFPAIDGDPDEQVKRRRVERGGHLRGCSLDAPQPDHVSQGHVYPVGDLLNVGPEQAGVPEGPWEVGFDPDGSWYYVVNTSSIPDSQRPKTVRGPLAEPEATVVRDALNRLHTPTRRQEER